MTGMARRASMPENSSASSARSISGTADAEGLHPGPLDQIEDLVPVLLAHGIAENGTEQPNVLSHRLGGLAAH